MADIAFLGLGLMGQGMVRNLLKAGHRVTGWNRTHRSLPDEIEGHDGFERASTLSEAVADQIRIFVCLTGPEAQIEVLLDDDGAIAQVPDGAIIVDSTTTDPLLSEEIGEAAAGAGITYLDCPVFGSKGEAWNGELDFVCGGPAAGLQAVRPFLDGLGKSVHHFGDVGTGAAMKLIGNLMVAAQLASLGEGLSIARRVGLDPNTVMNTLDLVDFSSKLISNVGRSSLSGDFQPSFHLRNLLKDARLISDYARELGVPLATHNATGETVQAAVNVGFGELNASALHKLQFRLAGLGDDD